MSFVTAIGLFLEACPGPPLAQAGLRIAALQPVKGIPGLGGKAPAASERGESDADSYLSSARQIGDRLECRAEYLCRAAGKHGYSFTRALRWMRFLHAMALLAEGCRVETVAYRLGFSDIAGWSRFTKRLVGRSRSQLPVVPLELWVRKAMDDVFFGVPACVAPRGGGERGENDNKKDRFDIAGGVLRAHLARTGGNAAGPHPSRQGEEAR